MNHRAGLDRSQTLLLPERLEDYIAAENPVRFLDAFVASLDLHALGFAKAIPAYTGAPPYDPGDLLRLYLYGYLCIACVPRACWRPNVSATWKCSGCWASWRRTSRPSPTFAASTAPASSSCTGSSICSATS